MANYFRLFCINLAIGLLGFFVETDLSAQDDSDGLKNSLVLKGEYLGQKPPGLNPEIFAPGIISTEANEGCIIFTHDNKLLIFTRADKGILLMQRVNNIWMEPRLAPFSVGKCDWDFMLAPDDKTVFISSGRPDITGDEPLRDYRIWIFERSGNEWSIPVLLPAPVNTGQHDSYPCATGDGTLYFFSTRDGGFGEGDIYRSRKVGDSYPEVENLGPPINTKDHEVDAYVDPEESYMIFCSDKPGGMGDADFYISFSTEEGNWSEPLNMGAKINSEGAEYIPYVSPDGKYFFFTSDKSGNWDIYWVDAGIIEELKFKME